jgi:peptidoglycan lytic transglycosylase
MQSALIGLLLLIASAFGAVAQQTGAGAALANAMKAVEEADWAQAARAAAPAGQIGRDIVEWHRLRAGEGAFDDYISFLQRRANWPGLPLLRKMGEANIPETARPDQVIAYFAPQDPRTGTGALRLAAAYAAKGARGDAQAEIVRAWRTLSLTKEEEDAFLAKYSRLLADHHRARQDMLLWRDLASEAERLNPLVGSDYRKLAQARIGLIKGTKGVGALIGAVPAKLKDDPGLAFARFQWRLRNKLPDGAIALLMARSTSAKALGKPEAWADRRRSLARQLMRDGKPKKAYAMAANHFLTDGNNIKDLEWLAGFIALTDLNDPKTALRHFQRFRANVDTPISLGRAGYWEGRAQEALGNTEAARAAYAFGAEYQTSFYGQLAAEKAGIAMDKRLTGRETYPDFRNTQYGKSSVLAAALMFHDAGYPLLFTRFTRQLAEILTPEERGSLAQLALNLDEPYAAVYLAKYAAKSGDVLMRPYFPVTDILSSHMPVPPELTLSIVRRESEFFPGSTSPVGARGLMQLMPKTGQAMAKKLNVRFELERLITDPAYNANLGSAYLGQLVEEFGPYYPFVAAGYNAGPSRPKRWARLFGDPRRSPEAAVDWIEHIPFRETRNYVMRVMESLAVYRARLTGKTGPWRLSKDLAGR